MARVILEESQKLEGRPKQLAAEGFGQVVLGQSPDDAPGVVVCSFAEFFGHVFLLHFAF
jgi:hypothetical protein